MRGTNGDDDLYGNNGNNIIYGLRGSDYIVGYRGDDILFGDDGKDILNGGAGRDILIGGQGSDFLTGGSGADDFWFNSSVGIDTVNDLGAGDRLLIDPRHGDFKGVTLGDIRIVHGSSYDWLYIEGDKVAKVYGDYLHMTDVFLV